MKLILPLIYTSLLFNALMGTLFAQSSHDSNFVAKVEHQITKKYIDHLGGEAPIFNGKKYRPFLKLERNSHAYFSNNQYLPGSINYNGFHYPDLNLMYDLVNDQLILLNFDKTGGIVVPQELVSSFSISKQHFTRIKTGVSNRRDISPGYYQILYQGDAILLARRTKKIDEIVSSEGIKYGISQQDKYYLFKDGAYQLIRNKKDLVKALSSTHNQNLSYIKKENLDFSADKEGSMIRLLSFHDSKK